MKYTSQSELKTLLEDLEVVAGDKVFIHAFIPSLGIVKGGLTSICEVICDHIGKNGTLIVPSFTASYRRSEVYDVEKSKSFNGSFSEYVRNLPAAVRSLDPLFSMAAIGKDAEELMFRTGNACFGHDSIYEKLFYNNIKFIGFGIEWNQGYSFFMHLERLANIHHRKDKTYLGHTRLLNGVLISDKAVHFSRREDMQWKLKRDTLCTQLLSNGYINEVVFGGHPHRLFESSVIEEEVLGHLRDDPWCMTDRASV